MSKFKSVLANSATTGAVVLGILFYLARTLFTFVLAFSVAWFGWTLTGSGFWKSALGWLLLVNGAGYCLWNALELMTFPFGVVAFSLSDEAESIPAMYRFFMSIFSFLVSAVCIVAIVFYIGFLITPNADKIDYDNKFVFDDPNSPVSEQRKIYSDPVAVAKDLKRNVIQIDDWIIVFSSDKLHPRRKTLEAKALVALLSIQNQNLTQMTADEIDKLFARGYKCSTFPSASSSIDVFKSIAETIQMLRNYPMQ